MEGPELTFVKVDRHRSSESRTGKRQSLSTRFEEMTMIVVSALQRAAAVVAIGISAAGASLAHPGHDTAPPMGWGEGLAHLLSQPDHIAMLVGAVAAGVVAARVWRAARVRPARRP